MKDIIINWLFDKRKKGYTFYIQQEPFNETTKYFVSEKRLISLGINQDKVMDIIGDCYQCCEDITLAISMTDNILDSKQ